MFYRLEVQYGRRWFGGVREPLSRGGRSGDELDTALLEWLDDPAMESRTRIDRPIQCWFTQFGWSRFQQRHAHAYLELLVETRSIDFRVLETPTLKGTIVYQDSNQVVLWKM